MPRKNIYLKSANTEVEFTPDQVFELKKCAADPIYFICNYVKIQHPVRGIIPFEMYEYQKNMIRAYQDNRFVVVLSARQTGKMIELDTKLPTPTGWTTMREVAPGDEVMGADGKSTKVTWVSDITTPNVSYKLHFDTGETQLACSDHEWEVEQKYKSGYQVLTTQQMVDIGVNVGDKNESRFKIKTTKPLDLPKKTLPIDPYTLGVWLGDGTSRTGEITTHKKDKELLEFVDSQYKKNSREYKPDIITTTLHGIRQHLQENSLLQNKHIPVEYLRSSFEQRLALLQGLMDTDGYVDSMGRGQCDITLANEKLAKDVFHLVCSLGLKGSFKERTVNGFIRFEIKFSAYSSEIEVFRLPRKLNNMKRSPSPTRKYSTKKRSIQKIERVESVPMKCIGVDNTDKLYLFGDACIPTHNSISAAAFLLWYATFHFDKTVLIASNKNTNAMEMIFRIRTAYEHLPMWLKPGVLDDGWNKHNIGFDNGSRIISEATSENSGRGLSISLLFLDEFAFVAPSIQDEFWTSISPTLSTGGACIMTSTPNGDVDIYAQIWRGAQVGANGFYPIRVRWDEPPGRDDKFKEEETGRVGERKWLQEYECHFLSSEALLIKSIILANMTPRVEAMKPINVVNDVVFWHDVLPGRTYLIGVDPSAGTGEDFSVITIYSFPELKQVGEYRSNTMSTNDLYGVLKNVLLFFEKKQTMVYFSIENNGVGEGVISLFEADERPPDNAEFVSEEGLNKRGMTTTSKTKMRACVNLKEMIEKDNLEISSRVLLAELKMFVRSKGAYAAQLGGTDDCISATLIIARLIEEIATYDQVAFDKLYSGPFNKWDDAVWDGYEGGYDEADEGLPMSF